MVLSVVRSGLHIMRHFRASELVRIESLCRQLLVGCSWAAPRAQAYLPITVVMLRADTYLCYLLKEGTYTLISCTSF